MNDSKSGTAVAGPGQSLEFLNASRGLKFEYQQCSRCVLDTFVSDITFDPEGICNYCKDYDRFARETVLLDEETKKEKLSHIISEIQAAGKGNPYDSIIGLSGGADSSYLVYLAHQFGLRPLIVHFDNGWNSETSVRNVRKVVTKLGLELYTHVINWEQFKN